MTKTSERIWQNDWRGLVGALREARRIAKNYPLQAWVERASALYSFAGGQRERGILARGAGFICFLLAKGARTNALTYAGDGYRNLSAEQCDVLGTITLRGIPMIPGDPLSAERLFRAGLKREKCSLPHIRALLNIGLAEAELALGNKSFAKIFISDALTMQAAVFREKDAIQARRQWIRVLRRAGTVLHSIGDRGYARELWVKAELLANDPDFGSAGQSAKLREVKT